MLFEFVNREEIILKLGHCCRKSKIRILYLFKYISSNLAVAGLVCGNVSLGGPMGLRNGGRAAHFDSRQCKNSSLS